jgi:hypothetical protein
MSRGSTAAPNEHGAECSNPEGIPAQTFDHQFEPCIGRGITDRFPTDPRRSLFAVGAGVSRRR